jgi:hypothetical protein
VHPAGLCRSGAGAEPVAGEAVAIWARIALALERGSALDEEARQYLLEAAQRVDLAARDPRVPPKAVARALPAMLGLAGADIAAHRKANRDLWARHLLDHLGTAGVKKSEDRAARAAGIVGARSRRTVYRRASRRRS